MTDHAAESQIYPSGDRGGRRGYCPPRSARSRHRAGACERSRHLHAPGVHLFPHAGGSPCRRSGGSRENLRTIRGARPFDEPAVQGLRHGDHRFAREEPNLFRLLFLRRRDTAEFPPTENHSADIRRAIRETFSLTDAQADELHRHLWIYVHGLCTLIVTGVNDIPDTEAARLLGEVCRALLIAQRVPRDARTAIVPGKKVDAGALGEYIAEPDKK